MPLPRETGGGAEVFKDEMKAKTMTTKAIKSLAADTLDAMKIDGIRLTTRSIKAYCVGVTKQGYRDPLFTAFRLSKEVMKLVKEKPRTKKAKVEKKPKPKAVEQSPEPCRVIINIQTMKTMIRELTKARKGQGTYNGSATAGVWLLHRNRYSDTLFGIENDKPFYI